MKLFEKIKINLKNGKSRQIRICGLPVFQYDKIKDENNQIIKRYYFPSISKKEINKEKPVFYLKVNRDEYYTYINLQSWLNVVNKIGADYYIICDNKKLEHKILQRLNFKNTNIKFIKSAVNDLYNISENIATKNWKKAAYAHLTTFLHSKKCGIQNFWNIDADDTMFLQDTNIVAKILLEVQSYAQKNDLSVFSLDMWRSRTNKKHWSFGITYTQHNIDWFKIFNENPSIDWSTNYLEYAYEFNIDYFFTYLKDHKKLKIETFYVDNCYFVHWGDFLSNPIASSICFWSDKKLYYPILSEIYKDEDSGVIPIANDCIKFDFGIKKETCLNYALKHITNLKCFLPETQKLWGIEKLCNKLTSNEMDGNHV